MSCTKNNFDIIGVTETGITKQVSLLNNLNLNNYSYEFTLIETTAGGTLLYIAYLQTLLYDHLSYKCRKDLNIYKKNELESTFVEIANFNVNLLNYNEHNPTNEFLDSLASNSFLPLILQPTRTTSHSNTLIDNLFSNIIDPDIISVNLTATIPDHLPQFAIIPNMFGNTASNKSNIYERGWRKFDRENFILDYFSIDWEDLLKVDGRNIDNSIQLYLEKINILSDTYAFFKRIDKYKVRFKSKPWITLGLQKSISVKIYYLLNSLMRSTLY